MKSDNNIYKYYKEEPLIQLDYYKTSMFILMINYVSKIKQKNLNNIYNYIQIIKYIIYNNPKI